MAAAKRKGKLERMGHRTVSFEEDIKGLEFGVLPKEDGSTVGQSVRLRAGDSQRT